MIKSFYKYVRYRYLGDFLNNFICDKSIWITFICASMLIMMGCYMFKTTNEWEWLTIFPIFLIENFYSLLLFNFHANYCQYLKCPCGFDIRSYVQIITFNFVHLV